MFLIQDGHQTHTRVEDAIGRGHVSGVIWSLGDHSPQSLQLVLDRDCMAGQVQAIDPQLYVARLADANPKKIVDHNLFRVPLKARDFGAQRVGDLVSRVLSFQADLPVSHVLTPTVAVASMADRSAQIAADLAETAVADWDARSDARPLLVSVAIEEALLQDEDNVAALLDELTAFDVEGFYILFELNPDRDPASAAPIFERALYVIHTLALNDYQVWTGYAGLAGYPMRAAGANAFAGGWFGKQRWWSPGHWSAGGGGRQPRPRIYLAPLLGSLTIDTELRLASRQRRDATLFEDLIDGPGDLVAAFRARRQSFDDDPGRPELVEQLFAVCAFLDRDLAGGVEADLRRVLVRIEGAEALHDRIASADIVVDTRSGRRMLPAWRDAVHGLADRAGLDLS